MKTKLLIFALLAGISSLIKGFGQENNVRIKDILSNPSGFKGELVTVSGLVTQHIEASERTTASYLIRDDYGSVIKINSADSKPETNKKYNVKGIVYFDESLQLPFISETARTKIETPVVYQPVETNPVAEKSWITKNLLFIILGTAGLLLIILASILLIRRKRANSVKTYQHETKLSKPFYERTMPASREDLKTMVIAASSPQTMNFIPGELEVLTGDDRGKTQRLSGYPTEEGSIVTLGRESVSGPKDFAHIQLKEGTISRKQAELIYKDGKLYIKNLSETNYTKLDGREIPPNTSLELKPSSVITLGEIDLKYNLNIEDEGAKSLETSLNAQREILRNTDTEIPINNDIETHLHPHINTPLITNIETQAKHISHNTASPDRSNYLYGVKGWLGFFVTVNLYIAPVIYVIVYIIAWISFVQIADNYPGIILVGIIETVVVGFLVWRWIQIARGLRDIQPGVIQEAKTWLKVSLGWGIFDSFLVFMSGLDFEDLLPVILRGILGGLIGFAIWYSYFNVSKRVRATYPDWND